MTLTLVLKGFHHMEKQLRPELRARNPAECDQILKQMWTLALTGMEHQKPLCTRQSNIDD